MMDNQSQTVELTYAGERLWFSAIRFSTLNELHAALIGDGIRGFDEKTDAYTVCYPNPDKRRLRGPRECGRMYLLSKSVETLAREASNMAFGIAESSPQSLSASSGDDWSKDDFTRDHGAMTGHIASVLYGKQKFY